MRGHGMISICMIKLYDGSICKPLEIIFQSCLNQRANVVTKTGFSSSSV